MALKQKDTWTVSSVFLYFPFSLYYLVVVWNILNCNCPPATPIHTIILCIFFFFFFYMLLEKKNKNAGVDFLQSFLMCYI